MPDSRIRETDYYSIARGGMTPERQEAEGWRARVDAPRWMIPEPIDWTADPFGDKNWISQYHGWRHMDPYLRAWQLTGDATRLAHVIPWMVSWVTYRDSAPADLIPRLDSLAGMRATRLAIVLDAWQTGALALTDTDTATLLALAQRDGAWLAVPENVALMNHAYFQILGLELLTRVLAEQPWTTQARQAITDRFNELVAVQFTEEGVHVENSPCYHGYALDQIRRSGALETMASAKSREVLARAEATLPWFVFPDGAYTDIGDCTGPAKPLADAGEHVMDLDDVSYAVAPFWRSGYAIIRSLPDVPLDEASMLLLVGASLSHIHSHADKLSFEWMEFGRRIIVDTGKYGYLRDPMRDYIESAVAHNTVGLADHPIKRREVTLGATKLKKPAVKDGAFRLRGNVTWETPRYAFTHHRDMAYGPGRFLLIRDALSSDTPHAFASRLHFDRSLGLVPEGDGFVTEVAGHRLTIMMLGVDERVTLHRGECDPIRGWQSVGYKQMEPTTMLEVVCPGTQRTITWALTLD